MSVDGLLTNRTCDICSTSILNDKQRLDDHNTAFVSQIRASLGCDRPFDPSRTRQCRPCCSSTHSGPKQLPPCISEQCFTGNVNQESPFGFRTAKPWTSRTIKTRILRMFQLFTILKQRLKRRLTTDHEPIFDPGVGGDRPSILTIHSTCDARLENFRCRLLITFS